MIILQAMPQDAKALFALEQEIFLQENYPLSLRSFYYHIKRNYLFIAKVKHSIVGYILLLKRTKKVKIYSLAVAKQYQNQHIAQQLLEYATHFVSQKGCKIMILEVRTDNQKAIKLYQKYQFSIINETNHFYKDGCSAYIMEKKLK
jgi:ribosomal-protein-alanine N-acetyltransferase